MDERGGARDGLEVVARQDDLILGLRRLLDLGLAWGGGVYISGESK